VLQSRSLNARLGLQVFFKCENFQRMGAFKFRGGFNALSRFTPTQRQAGVVAYSSGNHAQAIALSAQILGLPATIVMPHDASPAKLAATRAYGAQIVGYDRYSEDAMAIAQGLATDVNPGEGAFYGPKLEYTLRDAIGREWQCGTTQVDFNLPGRFGAFYIDEHSDKVTPVMLHRATLGSLERFTGILIEHFAGHFPLWLAPVQIIVATITQEADDYALEVVAAARRAGLRAEADLRNEKISYKVREHSLAKTPIILALGKKEAAERTVSIRRLGSQQQQSLPLHEALAAFADEAMAPDLKRAG
jgi:hypothetical protein